MKKTVILFMLASMAMCLQAQTLKDRLCFQTKFVIGMPLPDSDVKPLSLTGFAEYKVHPRFSTGLGTGLSKYDHLMIPVFATLHWSITQPRQFTPFLACDIGHAFAPEKDVNGGFFLAPSIGVRYQLKGCQSMTLSIGYELQEYDQLKSHESSFALSQYIESISNYAITIGIGFTF